MTDKLKEAMLSLRGHTSCAVYNDKLNISTEKGLKPLIMWLEKDGEFLRSASVADKIIGRAAAMIMVKGGVAEVYGGVMSRGAVAVFEEAGIPCSFSNTCIAISNRRGDGICPMEKAVSRISDPEEAYKILREKVLSAN
ncbi:MAG: DUF1893 domain-containing protein [Ruminococcaceae bacterium]|nr:DUF1893 domain-containing protein [Oscillospiraceae bacterium]